MQGLVIITGKEQKMAPDVAIEQLIVIILNIKNPTSVGFFINCENYSATTTTFNVANTSP